MRPQIRSLPLGKVECPQFSWAVRNNSANVCEALQPDLHQNRRGNEEEKNTEASCFCIEEGLQPTLFPHPVSCVCTNLPYPPRNEKYRYCRLNMGQAIGEVMEEKIMDLIPPCSPFPSPRQERIMKKIIRSAYIPEKVDLTEENACVDCLARDPVLLRELIESIKHTKGEEEMENTKKSCLEGFGADSRDCKRCKWRNDAICDCKETRQLEDDRNDCDKFKCKCMKGCTKCPCKTPQTSKSEFGATREEEAAEKRESMGKVHREIPEIDQKPLLPLPKGKKTKGKSRKKSKSPTKKQTLKRPESIICERFELVETNPTQIRDPSPVQIYEHFRAARPTRSASSKSNSETPETRSFSRSNSATTRRNSPTTLKNSRKTKAKPKKPSRFPWNWNNQPKAEDPLKRWNGTKYSWSRRMNYAKLGRKLEEEAERMARRDAEEPKYFEYKPNTRSRRSQQINDAENEEEIRRREEKRYREGYGRLRVKSWHQALKEKEMQEEGPELPREDIEQNAENSDDQCDVTQNLLASYNKLFPPERQEYEENPETKSFQNGPTVSEVAHLEDSDNLEASSGRKLSTIIEENPGKHDGVSDASAEMGKTYRATKENRPQTSDEAFLGEAVEKPFFNVIKQRIHSRNKTLENLDQFRQDAFPKKPEMEHTCVHRFTIDERLFPKPLHSDGFGTSCCIHCDKPMKTTEKSVFLDRREGCVQKQVSKFSLKPKRVHMGAKNSVMEIRLRPEHDGLLKGYSGGAREFYPDSMALRHQRR